MVIDFPNKSPYPEPSENHLDEIQRGYLIRGANG